MTDRDYIHLRSLLLDRRKELTDRVRSLEAGWEALGERDIELEEEAQKAGISEPYDLLDGRIKDEIEQIDLALSKMVVNDYGTCESCGDEIDLRRLEAIPWTRLCIECANEYERKRETLPETSEVIGSAKLPDDLQGLTNKQVERMIYERLGKEGRLDVEELQISVRKGVLYLEGALPGESEHQIVLRILTEEMGFAAVVDRLVVSDVMWETEDRTSGTVPPEATEEERLIYDGEEMSDDVFEAEESDVPYMAPESPPPYLR